MNRNLVIFVFVVIVMCAGLWSPATMMGAIALAGLVLAGNNILTSGHVGSWVASAMVQLPILVGGAYYGALTWWGYLPDMAQYADINAYLADPLFPGLVAVTIAPLMVMLFTLPREDGFTNHSTGRCIALMIRAAYFGGWTMIWTSTLYWPMATSAWDTPLVLPVFLVWYAVISAVAIVWPNRFLPFAVWYWGGIIGVAAIVLRWGIYAALATQQAAKASAWHASVGAPLESAGLLLWFVITVLVIAAVAVYVLWTSSVMGSRDLGFFGLYEPGSVRYVAGNTAVTLAYGDVTGVPEPKESLPWYAWLFWGNTQIWAWQLEDATKRLDPRPFLADWGWVGPRFGYWGLIAFAVAQRMREEFAERLGLKAMPLTRQTDKTFVKKDLVVNRHGYKVTLTLNISWRVVNPFLLWGIESLKDLMDQLVDRLAAQLAQEVGHLIYGFLGTFDDLERGQPAFEPSSHSPEVPELSLNPSEKQRLRGVLNHYRAAALALAGIDVYEIFVQAVEVPPEMEEILRGRLQAHVVARGSEEFAKSLGAATRGSVAAVVEATRDLDLDSDQRTQLISRVLEFSSLKTGEGGSTIHPFLAFMNRGTPRT